VRWTARLGAVTADALAVRLDATVASARARLRGAERAGLLGCHRPLAGQPPLYTATAAGVRACGERDLQPCRVSASGARHLIVCSHVAAALERCYPDHALLGERELRRAERVHGRPLASARIGWRHGGDAGVHRPDLVLLPQRVPDGLPVAVEVELTVKAPRRLHDICLAWARAGCVAGVLYLAPADVRRALARAVRSAAAGERIAVLGLDAVPGLCADGALDRARSLARRHQTVPSAA
jgi:hypothetical protein